MSRLAILVMLVAFACGPKPKAPPVMSSHDCVTWKCPQDSGQGECKCADK